MDWLLEGVIQELQLVIWVVPATSTKPRRTLTARGMVAMKITSGRVDGVDLSGSCWAGAVCVARPHGRRQRQPEALIDESATSSRAGGARTPGIGEGDTPMDIVRAVCPIVEEVLYVPFGVGVRPRRSQGQNEGRFRPRNRSRKYSAVSATCRPVPRRPDHSRRLRIHR